MTNVPPSNASDWGAAASLVDVETERLIAAAVVDDPCLLDFASPGYDVARHVDWHARDVVAAVVSMRDAGREIDRATVKSELGRTHENVTWFDALADMSFGPSEKTFTEWTARVVELDGARRAAIEQEEATATSVLFDADELTDTGPTLEVAASSFPTVVTLSNVAPTAVSWLWRSYLAYGVLSVVDGNPGLGKSTITHDLAARVTTGAPMPLEVERRAPADVILLTAEDHLSATVRPRCDAAGADVSKIHVITAMPTTADPDAPPMLTPADIARLELAIVRYSAKLVVVDPLMAFLDAKVDSAKDQDVRRVLRLLASVAERTGAAIVVVRHLRKSGGPAIYRGGGSIGIIGAARTGLLVARDPNDADVRVLAVAKSNLCRFPPALRFDLVDAGGVGRVEWTGIAEGVTADDLAAVPENVRAQDADPIDAAVAALQEILAGGPRPSREVETDVQAMTGCSPRTVDAARQRLGLVARKVGKVWHLALKDAKNATTRSRCVLDDAGEAKPPTPPRESRQKEGRNKEGRNKKAGVVASLIDRVNAALASHEEGEL